MSYKCKPLKGTVDIWTLFFSLHHIPFSVISHIFIVIDEFTKANQSWKLQKVIIIYTLLSQLRHPDTHVHLLMNIQNIQLHRCHKLWLHESWIYHHYKKIKFRVFRLVLLVTLSEIYFLTWLDKRVCGKGCRTLINKSMFTSLSYLVKFYCTVKRNVIVFLWRGIRTQMYR